MSTATGNSTHAVLPWSASPNVPTKKSTADPAGGRANKTRAFDIDAKCVCLIRIESYIFPRGTNRKERKTLSRSSPVDQFTIGLHDAYTDSRGKGGEYAGMAFAQQVFLVAGGVLRVDKLPPLCGWDLAAHV